MKSIAWKTLAAGVVTSVVTLTALAQPPEREGRRPGGDASPKKGGFASKKGGPADKGQGQMQGRGGMPMFKVGAVIPPFMIGQLDLSEKQQAAVQKLEADVARQLKEILNEEQFEMFSQPPQMGPGGPGFGPGGPGGPGGRGGFNPKVPWKNKGGGSPAKGARGKGDARKKAGPPDEE